MVRERASQICLFCGYSLHHVDVMGAIVKVAFYCKDGLVVRVLCLSHSWSIFGIGGCVVVGLQVIRVGLVGSIFNLCLVVVCLEIQAKTMYLEFFFVQRLNFSSLLDLQVGVCVQLLVFILHNDFDVCAMWGAILKKIALKLVCVCAFLFL